MIRKILLFTVLFSCLTIPCKANTCAANATGNWATVGTWTSCGGVTPIAGDTVTIGSAFVVTVAASTSEIVGTDGATGTAAITVSGTAQLIINGTLNSRGDVLQTGEGTTVKINGGGTLVLDSLAGARYAWTSNNTGASTASMTIAGTAWTAGNFGTVNGSGGRGGTNGWINNQGSSLHAIISFTYAKFLNLGDASNQAYNHFLFLTGAVDVMSHVLWSNAGQVITNTNGHGINWDSIDFRSPLGPRVFDVLGAASTSIHSITNLTVYRAGTVLPIQIGITTLVMHDWMLYNTPIATLSNYVSQTMDKVFFLVDDPNPTIFLTVITNSADTMNNMIFLNHANNPHYLGGGAPDATLANNMLRGSVFDADGFVGSDSGDAVLGTANFNNNILINKAGTLFTALAAADLMTSTRNTAFQSYGATVGETAGAATQALLTRNNLFVSQLDGFHQASAMVSQSSWTMDYNGYYNMTGSNIAHPILGGNSYLGPATYAAWFASGAFGDDGKGLHDVTGDPQFADSTRTVRSCGGWASVQAAAREMMTINGLDYTGAATTPTAKSIGTILNCVRDGFRPVNSIYKNAGSAGDFIGAVPFSKGSQVVGPSVFQ